MATSLPPITSKQQDILSLLYVYRFLNRSQLQRLMGHKAKQPVIRLLKDLRDKRYLEWIYSTDFAVNTQPAIYYLGRNGIRYLRTRAGYPPQELRKRYQEASRTPAFIDACQLTADAALELAAVRGSVRFTWTTGAGCTLPGSPYQAVSRLQPSLCIVRYEKIGSQIDATPYLLEVCSSTNRRGGNRRRLLDCVSYLEEGAWEGTFPAKPILLVVCPDQATLRALKRYGRQLLDDYGQANHTYLRFTTVAAFKAQGIRSPIWEAA